MRNKNTNIKKMFDEILDKKFSKNMVAGYDALEVDIFLDNVRSHLVNLHNALNELDAIIRNKDEEILALQRKILAKEEHIKKQQFTIDSYIKDGYQNQRIVKEIGDLRATISELQNEKRNK